MPTAPTNLTVDDVRGRQFDLSFTDNASSKDGYRVYTGPDGYLESSGLDGGYVEIPDDPVLDVGGQMTIAIELKVTAQDVNSNNDYRIPIGRSGSYNPYGMLIEDQGTLHVSHYIGGSRIFGDTIVSVDVGDRLNVVYTLDATTGDYVGYVDGSQVMSGTYTTTGTIDSASRSLNLFGRGTNHNFAGHIYRATLDDRVWSASEASDYANGGSPADPVVHYELNQGSGSTAVDYGSNGLDGTLKNSPTWHGGGDIVQDGSDLDPQYGFEVLSSDSNYRTAGGTPIADAITSESFTFAFWYQWTGSSTDKWKDIYGWGDGHRVERNGNTDDLRFYFDGDTGPVAAAKATGAMDGNPHSVVFVCKAGTMDAYVDGTKVHSDYDYTADPDYTASSITSDGSFSVKTGYNFLTDDAILTTDEWGQTEVDKFHNGNTPTTNAVTHHKYNGDLTDSTSNNFDLSGTYRAAPSVVPIYYTTTDLLDGEQYVVRSSAFEGTTEEFDT